ncbi:MAG: hypothetical protein LBI57_08295 [Helicobacteraceae bacterium]|jgi:hypothetical protein|nr:hypothetical protein [Helicobacteraceae bacterium]
MSEEKVGTEEVPEQLYLLELKKRADQTEQSASGFRLKEDAFAIYIDAKTIDSLIYQNTQQTYKELISKAVDHGKNSYPAHFEAARILKQHEVVINRETISGVIAGELAYIRAQAEHFVWDAIVACPASLKVINDSAHITTIPVSRFVVLHLFNYDLSFGENEYMLNKKSRADEDERGAVEFDGHSIVAGEVSAVSVSRR